MKPRLVFIFVLIVLAPLAILGWLGARVALNERDAMQSRMRDVLMGRLRDIDAGVRTLLEDRGRAVLAEGSQIERDLALARATSLRSPLVRQYLVVGQDGLLEYPPREGPLSGEEEAFLTRTSHIWESGGFPQPGEVSDSGKPRRAASKVAGQWDATASNQGWYVWYWGDGLNLIYWWRAPDGRVFGGELNASRLTADIIASLPDGRDLADQARIVVRDSRGRRLHQWGAFEPSEGEPPQATLALSWPLASWTLEYHAAPESIGRGYGRGMLMNLAVGLTLLAVAICALAVYYYRESSREMREAAQRITFVNQVSHELKTPLTNIRMYAELLEDDLQLRLPEHDGPIRRHLQVIVAESQRLSRLIGNVLTFSRKQRGALTLHQAPGCVDDVLRAVAAKFEAALEAKGIGLELDLGAARPARFDADVLEQIVGNLLGNVDKYAAGATRAAISSRQNNDIVDVVVEDNGPGIPPREAARVFKPFYRVSSRLTDGVAGTGIGLTIARDLARLHGGDLVLEPGETGARFRATLNAPVDDASTGGCT